MNRSFYYTLLSIYNNCILNVYLCGYLIFPNYFSNKITTYKKNSDEYYNKMLLLSFTDNIYNKYNIDLLNIHKHILETIKKNKNTTNEYWYDDEDTISIMSDLSDLSDMSDISMIDDDK